MILLEGERLNFSRQDNIKTIFSPKGKKKLVRTLKENRKKLKTDLGVYIVCDLKRERERMCKY